MMIALSIVIVIISRHGVTLATSSVMITRNYPRFVVRCDYTSSAYSNCMLI